MWKNVIIGTLSALLVTVVLALAGQITSGSIIRFLGGATAVQLEEVEKRIVELSAIEFDIKTRTVTQADEEAAGGAETILLGLQCPDGWLNGPGFSETYVFDDNDDDTYRKYARICFRAS